MSALPVNQAIENLADALSSILGFRVERPGLVTTQLIEEMRGHLGHEPHSDLVAWYAFAGANSLQDIYLGLSPLNFRSALRELDSPVNQLADDPDRLIPTVRTRSPASSSWVKLVDVDCLAIHIDVGGGIVVASPTSTAEAPKVSIIGDGDVYFYYPPHPSDIDNIPDPIRDREELPTIGTWLNYLAENLRSGYIVAEKSMYGITYLVLAANNQE